MLLNLGCQQAPPSALVCSTSLSLLDTNAVGKNGYEHFVVLNGYEDSCFSWVAFADLAHTYTDTVRRSTPVWAVTFLRPASQKKYDRSEPDIVGLFDYQIASCQMDGHLVKQISAGAHGREKTFSVKNKVLNEE